MCEHKRLKHWYIVGGIDGMKDKGECHNCGLVHSGKNWEEVRLKFGRQPKKEKLNYKSILYEVATAGISMVDPRIRYVEIQIDKKTLNEIRKMFGLDEV